VYQEIEQIRYPQMDLLEAHMVVVARPNRPNVHLVRALAQMTGSSSHQDGHFYKTDQGKT
jgi:hypothetical protein